MSDVAHPLTGGRNAPALRRDLRRDPEHGMIAGVCEGIGRRLDIDPLLLRIVFGATTFASGLGVAAYLLAWWLLPVEGAQPAAAAAAAEQRSSRNRRAALEVGIGVGCLVVSILLTFRELGLPFSDALTWPLVLVAAGGALIWRQSVGRPGTPGATAVATAVATAGATPGALAPLPLFEDQGDSRPAVISRIGIGVTLVITAAIVFLQISGALAAASDVALAALVVAIALVVIFAPFFVRLLTSLSIERAERIRSQERSEVAAHLHDSVLQTLALVQRRAGDPREVANLARRQERELRAWLNGGRPEPGDSLAGSLEAAAAEVEETHGVPIDVVAVGDAPIDEQGAALVAAAREALVNAAKFAGGGAGGSISLYAEVGEERTEVFVRDRGPGFDLAAVSEDRRGVRESIVGRMHRHGGSATVHSTPGGGTEVELVIER